MSEDKLKGFKRYGFKVNSTTSSQAIGDCVFCGKEDKFYVNQESQLWDCKVCGKKGNYFGFLFDVHKESLQQITKLDLEKLATNRGLPVSAFEKCKIGKRGNDYLFPIYSPDGKLQDVRSYRPGNKFLSSPGCQVSLFGFELLNGTEKDVPVYLCEGEWDAIALRWLLKTVGERGVCLGTPGAATFKNAWVPYFKDRHVIVLYDNDAAGENGDNVVQARLSGSARSLSFLHWPSGLAQGYDIRDLIKDKAVKEKKPKFALSLLKKLLRSKPRGGKAEESSASEEKVPTYEIKDRTVTLQKVFKVFEKWLHKPNHDAIELALSSVISNELQGDPLWLFLVAPPGGSKTEILNAFDTCTNTYITSSLTPQSLISGSVMKGGGDPSLIPKLNGKTLIVKDFTSILGKREVEKDEIFGILRDAYDGKSGKVFGTGVTRYYRSHFSILSAVTPSIYELSSQYTGLGERFLKFFMGDSIVHVSEKDIIRRSMRNVNRETGMREEIAQVVKDYVSILVEEMRAPGYKIPDLPEAREDQIIATAQYIARLRASVPRDNFNKDIILSKPSVEVGSRLGKQLARIALCISAVNRKKAVDDHAIRILKKVALDTISQRNEALLRVIHLACPTQDDGISTKEVAFRSRYPIPTVNRVLNDMFVLDILTKIEINKRVQWRVSDYVMNLIKDSTMYTIPAEIKRPVGEVRIAIKRRNKK